MSCGEKLRDSISEIRRARRLTVYEVSWKPGQTVRSNLTEIRMILTEQLAALEELAGQMDTTVSEGG